MQEPPLKNTTVSHISPLLNYIPRIIWFEGTPNDTNLVNYAHYSYHATNSTSGRGSVSLEWYGQGSVWVYGAHRSRLGPYQVILDSRTISKDGFVQGDEEDYDAVLFHKDALEPGSHHIEVANIGVDPGGGVLDIERIVFQSSLGSNSTIDLSGPNCSWAGSWSPPGETRTTMDLAAGMEARFEITPNDPSTTGESHLLFVKYGLSPGNHTLQVRNNPSGSTFTSLNIDRLNVFSAIPPPPSQKVATSIIVGTSIAGSIILIFVSWALWMFCNKKHMSDKKEVEKYRSRPFNLNNYRGVRLVPQSSPSTPITPLHNMGISKPQQNDRRGKSNQGDIQMRNVGKAASVSSKSSSSGSSIGGLGLWGLQDKGKGKMRDDDMSTLGYSIRPNPPSSPPYHSTFHPERFARTYPPSPPLRQQPPRGHTDLSKRSDSGGDAPVFDPLSEGILIIGDPSRSASSTPAPSHRSPTASTMYSRPLSSIAPTRHNSDASTGNRRARSRSVRRGTSTTTTTATTFGSLSISSFPPPPPLPAPIPRSPYGYPRALGIPIRSSPEPIEDLPDVSNFPPPALPQGSPQPQSHPYPPPQPQSSPFPHPLPHPPLPQPEVQSQPQRRPTTPRSRPHSYSSSSAHQSYAPLHGRSRSSFSLPRSPPPPPITPRRPPLPIPPQLTHPHSHSDPELHLQRSPAMQSLDVSNPDVEALFYDAEESHPHSHPHPHPETDMAAVFDLRRGANQSGNDFESVPQGPPGGVGGALNHNHPLAEQSSIVPRYRSPEER